MLQVFAALNALGETGWVVNKPVFAVAETAWKQHLAIPGMPIQKNLELLPEPTCLRYRLERSGTQLLALVTTFFLPMCCHLSRPGVPCTIVRCFVVPSSVNHLSS